jgi:hypothetical protein
MSAADYYGKDYFQEQQHQQQGHEQQQNVTGNGQQVRPHSVSIGITGHHFASSSYKRLHSMLGEPSR